MGWDGMGWRDEGQKKQKRESGRERAPIFRPFSSSFFFYHSWARKPNLKRQWERVRVCVPCAGVVWWGGEKWRRERVVVVGGVGKKKKNNLFPHTRRSPTFLPCRRRGGAQAQGVVGMWRVRGALEAQMARRFLALTVGREEREREASQEVVDFFSFLLRAFLSSSLHNSQPRRSGNASVLGRRSRNHRVRARPLVPAGRRQRPVHARCSQRRRVARAGRAGGGADDVNFRGEGRDGLAGEGRARRRGLRVHPQPGAPARPGHLLPQPAVQGQLAQGRDHDPEAGVGVRARVARHGAARPVGRGQGELWGGRRLAPGVLSFFGERTLLWDGLPLMHRLRGAWRGLGGRTGGAGVAEGAVLGAARPRSQRAPAARSSPALPLRLRGGATRPSPPLSSAPTDTVMAVAVRPEGRRAWPGSATPARATPQSR
jgi:hypothetical protein